MTLRTRVVYYSFNYFISTVVKSPDDAYNIYQEFYIYSKLCSLSMAHCARCTDRIRRVLCWIHNLTQRIQVLISFSITCFGFFVTFTKLIFVQIGSIFKKYLFFNLEPGVVSNLEPFASIQTALTVGLPMFKVHNLTMIVVCA